MSHNLPDPLIAMLTECAIELTQSVGLQDYKQGRDPATYQRDKMLAAVIGFTDPKMNGSLIVMAAPDLLTKSHPNAAMGMPINEQDVADWIGELANQLLGRLKNRVVRCGLAFAMNTPTVMAGSAIRPQSVKDQKADELVFSGILGPVFVRIDARIETGVEFVEKESAKAASEGDSMFF